MAVGDAYVFPGFLTPVLTHFFLPKPPTTFLTCFCRGERRKYAGKKSRLDWGSNSQPQGHESDTLTTEPPRWGTSLLKALWKIKKLLITSNFSFSHSVFYPSGEHSGIFIKFEIVACKFFQFGRVLFVIRERVKTLTLICDLGLCRLP